VRDLVKRTWSELQQEIAFISRHLQAWWGGMSQGEQLFAVGIICAALLLLGLRSPPKVKTVTYDGNVGLGRVKEFLFAAVVIIIFTFGVDIAVESASS